MSKKRRLTIHFKKSLAGLVFLSLSETAFSGPNCQSLFGLPEAHARTESQTRLQQQWDILDEMKSTQDKKLRRQALRVVNEIKAVWSEQGIAYEVDPASPYDVYLAIPKSPQELRHAHPLNRMAASMQKHFAVKVNGQVVSQDFRVKVNPLELKREDAGAIFDEETSSLTLARDNTALGQIDDMVVHETRHAFNFYEFAAGNDHDFAAWISNSEKLPVFDETYPHLFSADELTAYVKQLNLLLRLAVRNKESLDDARDFVEVAVRLADAAARPQVLDVSRQIVSDMRQNPKNWSAPLKAKEKIDGVDVDVLRVRSAKFKSRVYFYKTPLLEESTAANPLMVTHAVFENGDYKLDLMTLAPLDASNLSPLLSRIEEKIAHLQARVDGIQKNLHQAQTALSKDDAREALQAVHRALPYISIKRKKTKSVAIISPPLGGHGVIDFWMSSAANDFPEAK